jgi:hypothetical protein
MNIFNKRLQNISFKKKIMIFLILVKGPQIDNNP